MDYIVNDETIIIKKDVVFRKSTQDGKTGIISINENNQLIVKAFATAWKYKEMYERIGDVRLVAKAEVASPMTIYRYLNLAYMNPHKINDIMSGKIRCTVDELLKSDYNL